MQQPSKHNQIIKKINSILRRKDVIHNLEYSRLDLASDLGIGYTLMKQIIHDDMGSTFRDLLNLERVKHAKKLLESPAHRNDSIEEIATLAGFNSRTTMHRAFVKHLGAAPGEFRKE